MTADMLRELNPWPAALKAVRRSRCWTQVEAAKEFRVPARTWIAWENAHYKPRPKIQRQLREFFKEELQEFFKNPVAAHFGK